MVCIWIFICSDFYCLVFFVMFLNFVVMVMGIVYVLRGYRVIDVKVFKRVECCLKFIEYNILELYEWKFLCCWSCKIFFFIYVCVSDG